MSSLPTLRPPRAAARGLALLAGALATLGSLPARAQAPINGCAGADAGTLAQCHYRSPQPSYTPAVVDLVLQDPARGDHVVPIRVRYPVGASGARPVVIWNHGGGTTGQDVQASQQLGTYVTRGQQSSVRRSESFARAGYVVIHIGRLPPSVVRGHQVTPTVLGSDQMRDCVRAGVVAAVDADNPNANVVASCAVFIGWHLWGPRNVAFVADMLQHYRVGMLPGFEGTLDREKIIVGGWSGGSASGLNIAGAYQQWSNGEATLRLDPVPVPGVAAFFLDSPRGPAYAGYSSGFQEDSSFGIGSLPLLINTARGDRGPGGEPVAVRNVHFFGAAKGDKVMSYSWTPTADGGPNHGTMDINDSIDEATNEPASGCNTALREEHCAALEMLGVAFLDAKVRGIREAQDWLASGNFKVLTRDRIELHRR